MDTASGSKPARSISARSWPIPAGRRSMCRGGRSSMSSCSPGRWNMTHRSCCSAWLASTWPRGGWCARVWSLLERVASARERARAETWALLAHLVKDDLEGTRRRGELDALLVPDPELGCTPLRWLETGPATSSPAAVKTELAKLAYLRRLDAHTLDLSMLPAERRRFLAGVGRRLTGQALARRDPERRYPILLALLAESAVDVLDEVVLLFDQALSGRESAARTRLREVLAERAREGEDRQVLLDEILAVILDLDIAEDQVGALLREGIGMERMRGAWAARKERLPRDHGHLAMLDAAMSYLRQFTPRGPGRGALRRRARYQRPPVRGEDARRVARYRRPQGPRRRTGGVRARPLGRL